MALKYAVAAFALHIQFVRRIVRLLCGLPNYSQRDGERNEDVNCAKLCGPTRRHGDSARHAKLMDQNGFHLRIEGGGAT